MTSTATKLTAKPPFQVKRGKPTNSEQKSTEYNKLLSFVKRIAPKNAEIKTFGFNQLFAPEIIIRIKNWHKHDILMFIGTGKEIRKHISYFKKYSEQLKLSLKSIFKGFDKGVFHYKTTFNEESFTAPTPQELVKLAVLKSKQNIKENRIKKQVVNELLKLDKDAYIDASGKLNSYSYLIFKLEKQGSTYSFQYQNIHTQASLKEIQRRLSWLVSRNDYLHLENLRHKQFYLGSYKELKKLNTEISTGHYQLVIPYIEPIH